MAKTCLIPQITNRRIQIQTSGCFYSIRVYVDDIMCCTLMKPREHFILLKGCCIAHIPISHIPNIKFSNFRYISQYVRILAKLTEREILDILQFNEKFCIS